MDLIFHEKQEGALCAQHCLNSLLQGPYYTAVDLACFARQLDDEEQQHMAEGADGVHASEYLQFMQQPSANMDDTGYFSIQVIQKALEVWSLEMVPFNSPSATQSRLNPTMELAYICNLQNHWFTIRKLGRQWFNLNSLLKEPELITNTYLSLLLAQLQNEGYAIFMIRGQLPSSEADQYLENYPVLESELRTRREANCGASVLKNENTEMESNSPASEQETVVDSNEVRRKRLKYFDGKSDNSTSTNVNQAKRYEDMTDDEKLEAALVMSMQNDEPE